MTEMRTLSSGPANDSNTSATTDAQRVSRTIRPLQPSDQFPDNTVINSRYTILTFLPMNLYQQFKRPLNLYFLLVAMLQFITVIAPVNPMSTLLPLLFAFTFTAAKEGYDDVKRHRADAEYNARKFRVLDPATGEWVVCESRAIKVGDVISLDDGQEVPCDCVGIAAPKHNNGIVYIRTDNLDGEIDLKPRDVVPRTGLSVDSSSPAQVKDFVSRISLTCPRPSKNIDSFETTIHMPVAGGADDGDAEVKTVGLSHLHLLLQSSYIKNTERVYAIVVYTGNETKCGQNKKPAPVKWAKVDQAVSRYSMIIFVTQILSAITLGAIGYAYNRNLAGKAWYLGLDFGEASGLDASNWSVIIFPLRFFLLTSVMIPISFKFVVDMSKAYMALVLEWDLQMYDEERGERMRVKDSSIVENLAQVEYVLSDKTGTLTQNIMTLRGASVDGARIDAVDEHTPRTGPARDLWTALALCNTVEVHDREPALEHRYHAVSPDEEALCLGAARLGVRLDVRTRDTAVVNVFGEVFTYRVISVFAFTSERRCMSVIMERVGAAEDAPDAFVLLTKGADDRIIGMLSAADKTHPSVSALADHVSYFARQGLRTLVFGRRLLPRAEVRDFERAFEHAMQLTDGRQSALTALQTGIERDLSIVGATAVEDLLQVDVKQTITQLLAANVGVWMLTGDKVETAQQIGVSCGLLPPSVSLSPASSCATPTYLKLTAGEWRSVLGSFSVSPELLKKQHDLRESRRAADNDGLRASVVGFAIKCGEKTRLIAGSRQRSSSSSSYGTSSSNNEPGPGGRNVSLLEPQHSDVVGVEGYNVLVEGGFVLEQILEDPQFRPRFLAAAMAAKAVVCARVTPSQKAAITAMVNAESATTLAIGDGGNDVAMIQEAHVGVGIIGKEGQQAARAADFAITQFRHLAELMFVHGHMSYARTCYVVQYSFYKSMLISFIQIAYNIFFGGMSGVSFWNSFFLTVWNGVFTLPQTLFYTVDRCAPRALLRKDPMLYRLSQRGYGLTKKTFFAFVFRGVAQSCGLLAVLYWNFSGPYANASDGDTEANGVVFTAGYTLLIFHQLFTVVIESNSITPLNALGIVGMPLVYLASTQAYSAIPTFQYYGVFAQTMTVACWLFVVCGVAVLFLPHLAFRMAVLARWPNALDEARAALISSQRQWHAATSRHWFWRFLRQWLTMPDDEIQGLVSMLPKRNQLAV